MAAFALASCAQFGIGAPTVVRGEVVEASDDRLAGARVRGCHIVPNERAADPRHPRWNGLLGETISDSSGHFSLTRSGRASLDYILADHGDQFGMVRRPIPAFVRVVINQERTHRPAATSSPN